MGYAPVDASPESIVASVRVIARDRDRATHDLDAATFRHAYWNVLFTGQTPGTSSRVGA